MGLSFLAHSFSFFAPPFWGGPCGAAVRLTQPELPPASPIRRRRHCPGFDRLTVSPGPDLAGGRTYPGQSVAGRVRPCPSLPHVFVNGATLPRKKAWPAPAVPPRVAAIQGAASAKLAGTARHGLWTQASRLPCSTRAKHRASKPVEHLDREPALLVEGKHPWPVPRRPYPFTLAVLARSPSPRDCIDGVAKLHRVPEGRLLFGPNIVAQARPMSLRGKLRNCSICPRRHHNKVATYFSCEGVAYFSALEAWQSRAALASRSGARGCSAARPVRC